LLRSREQRAVVVAELAHDRVLSFDLRASPEVRSDVVGARLNVRRAARRPVDVEVDVSATLRSAAAARRSERRTGDGDGNPAVVRAALVRSEEHTSELQSPYDLVCRLLLEKK